VLYVLIPSTPPSLLSLPLFSTLILLLTLIQQVTISLLVARRLTSYLWSKGLDPDMYALPIHSALMDLVGQLMLVVCFEIAQLLGARVRMVPVAGAGGGAAVG
jgi:solute carrier family 41